ncbi:carbohydrate kinase family protein [Yoonia sp. 208BN28-4]|uniref:carbohydrate kinase family protein n=1 Tax=Yoonia sp. 208BN28-4 TaxID=3126505 RepID=UPI00309CB70B
MTKPVLCAGRLYCDLVFADVPRLPTPGTEVFAPSLALHAGGGAFITGATLTGLGFAVTQLSYLPAAPFDMIVTQDMARHGVDPSLCQVAQDGADPQVTVAMTRDGDRSFLTRADGPALPDFSADTLHGYGHLHIGELRTLEEHPDLLTHARAAGLTVSLDCSWQDMFDPAVAKLIAAVDVFLPNETEAAALLALGLSDCPAPLTVVKRGKRGAQARRAGSTDVLDALPPPATVLDATGAGDAFNAGFLSQWLVGAPLDACLTAGNSCGAAAVQVTGGVCDAIASCAQSA